MVGVVVVVVIGLFVRTSMNSIIHGDKEQARDTINGGVGGK